MKTKFFSMLIICIFIISIGAMSAAAASIPDADAITAIMLSADAIAVTIPDTGAAAVTTPNTATAETPVPIAPVVATPVSGTGPNASAGASSGEGISVVIDGKFVEFDQPPIIQDGRTLVPFRAILEAMGASVDWDEATQTVSAALDENIVILTVGSNKAEKNSMIFTLDVPPVIMNGRTLVPVRFIAESFGAAVDWDGETQTVIIAIDDTFQWLLIHREKLTANSSIAKYKDDMYAVDFIRVPGWKPVAGIDLPNGSFVIVNDIIISINTDFTDIYTSDIIRSDLNGNNSKILDTEVYSLTTLWVYGNKIIYEREGEQDTGYSYIKARDGYYVFDAESGLTTKLYDSNDNEFIACDSDYAYFKSPGITDIFRVRWDGSSPSVKFGVDYPDSVFTVENGYYYLASEYYNANEIIVERYSIYDGGHYDKYSFKDISFLGIHNGYIYFSAKNEIGRMRAIDGALERLASPPPGVEHKSIHGTGFIDGYLYLTMYSQNVDNTATAKLYRIPQNGGELEYMGAEWTIYYE